MVIPLLILGIMIYNLIVAQKRRSESVPYRKNISYLLMAFFLMCFQISNAQKPSYSSSSSPIPADNSDHPHQKTVTSCPNSDFSEGNFTNWQGFYGTFLDPDANFGFITTTPNPRHLILHSPGTRDHNTCDGLMIVPEGEAFVARLGNDSVGAQAEQLRYTLTVTEESNLFIYKYAVVFEDPDHTPEDQPSFTIEVTNEAGEVFDSACGYYYVYAHPDLPGWHTCNYFSPPVLWKDWTTVGLDLSSYVGQTITIVFTTRDCYQTGHFGYAYLSTSCSKLQLSVDFCTSNGKVTLTAPPGFSYLWSNGCTTQSNTIFNPDPGKIDSCTLTSVNGCQIKIKAAINPTTIIADFNFLQNGPEIEIPFYDLSRINKNTIVNWEWDFGDGSPVVVNEQNPTHKFLYRGIYNVRLVVVSDEGCTDTLTRQVKIEIPSKIWFSNAFSPNGDGINDVFLPEASNIGKYQLSIFNRFGQSIFESDNVKQGWDGVNNGEKCPADVYVYYVTYELLEIEETRTSAGTVVLLR